MNFSVWLKFILFLIKIKDCTMSYFPILQDKATRLFVILGGFFVANALIAEFIGVKIFSVEQTLGITPFHINLLGINDLSFNMSAGVLLWPVVFIMTDVINEYFGKKGVQFLSFLTVGLIAYSFIMVGLSIGLKPADFWSLSHINSDLPAAEQDAIRQNVGNYNAAYALVYRQSNWIILGSLTAFLLGQLIDVAVFHRIKRMTGNRWIWLRSTGSTLISQFFDSFIVLLIAFYWGAGWSLEKIIALGLVAYAYKFLVAVLMTPVIYLVHYFINWYLGKEVAEAMRKKAHEQ
jgi:queuosine precursor transporter